MSMTSHFHSTVMRDLYLGQMKHCSFNCIFMLSRDLRLKIILDANNDSSINCGAYSLSTCLGITPPAILAPSGFIFWHDRGVGCVVFLCEVFRCS